MLFTTSGLIVIITICFIVAPVIFFVGFAFIIASFVYLARDYNKSKKYRNIGLLLGFIAVAIFFAGLAAQFLGY